jgi:hypothetical protein
VDVASQDHHIHTLVDALSALDSLKRGKFDMQVRQHQQAHTSTIL